jgi:hypothetical protein
MTQLVFIFLSLLITLLPVPVKSAEVICDPGQWECCSSTSHHKCNTLGTGWYSCTTCAYGCNSATGNCKSAPPTSTPKPQPSPTPLPAGYRCNNTYKGRCVSSAYVCSPATNYGQIDCLSTQKCVPEATSCALPTATPTPTTPPLGYSCQNTYKGRCVPSTYVCSPTTNYGQIDCLSTQKCVPEASSCASPSPSPAPTINPSVICYPNSTLCVDAVDTYDVAKIKTCNSAGTKQTTTYCGEFQKCDRNHTTCMDTMGSSVFRSSGCTNGSTKCEAGQKYTCISTAWLPNSDSSSCPQIVPSPSPTLNAYDCQIVNGHVICAQNALSWKNVVYPYQCTNPDTGKIETNATTLGNIGCSQSTACSMLCGCPNLNNSTNCNVNNCVRNIPEYSSNSIKCTGTGVDTITKILKRNQNCFSNVITLNQDAANGTQISRNEIYKYSDYGDIVIGAIFTDKITHEVYHHVSRICGKQNGKLLFCDTYFNSNLNSSFSNTPQTLEDRFDVTITTATLATK